jgi:serine protease inhibitor
MNKERFHNALALSLGYERIVKDKRIIIQVDDSDDPWVTLKFQGRPEVIRIKASGDADAALAADASELRDEIKEISDVVHQAYVDASSSRF